MNIKTKISSTSTYTREHQIFAWKPIREKHTKSINSQYYITSYKILQLLTARLTIKWANLLREKNKQNELL